MKMKLCCAHDRLVIGAVAVCAGAVGDHNDALSRAGHGGQITEKHGVGQLDLYPSQGVAAVGACFGLQSSFRWAKE
jgi:hypothetical protein